MVGIKSIFRFVTGNFRWETASQELRFVDTSMGVTRIAVATYPDALHFPLFPCFGIGRLGLIVKVARVVSADSEEWARIGSRKFVTRADERATD